MMVIGVLTANYSEEPKQIIGYPLEADVLKKEQVGVLYNILTLLTVG